MTQHILIKATIKNGTPVFMAQADTPQIDKVYGGIWDVDTRLWYFPAFLPVFSTVLRDLKVLSSTIKQDLVLSDGAKSVIKQLKVWEHKRDNGVFPDMYVPNTPLYAHQKEGLLHAIYNHRSALFFGCGLGKTLVVIDWQRATGVWPLILCPKIVVRNWAAEVKIHGVDQEFKVVDARTVHGKQKQLQDIDGYCGLVTSYDIARRYYEEIIGHVPYTAIVADESHSIKNPQSARTRAAIQLARKAARRIIMSGTPSLGNPLDMYSQLQFLSDSFVRENYWKFKHMFCVLSPRNKHIVTGYKNLDLLNTRVAQVALRKTKEECLDLPPRHEIDIVLPLAKKPRSVYNSIQLSEEYRKVVTQMTGKSWDNVLDTHGYDPSAADSLSGHLEIAHAAVLLIKLLQISSGFIYTKKTSKEVCDGCKNAWVCAQENIHPHTARCTTYPDTEAPIVNKLTPNVKSDWLEAQLDTLLADTSNKVIIWAQFRPELDIINALLNRVWAARKTDETHVRVDGATKNTQDNVDKFNTDPKCRVYLGQVATGVGLTLNAANYMVYYSLPWKLGDYEQSKDRNHRVGQRKDTVIYHLMGEGTVDEDVRRALRLKQDVARTVAGALTCPQCADHATCKEANTVIFSKTCRYAKRTLRHITKAAQI